MKSRQYALIVSGWAGWAADSATRDAMPVMARVKKDSSTCRRCASSEASVAA